MKTLKPVVDSKTPKKGRKPKSGTSYPYYNLKQSIEVANLVHSKGGDTCSRDQLASFLNYSTTRSGAYLTRISAAKLFGLIDIKKDKISITERAEMIIAPVMPEGAEKAKVDAFLAVPLFTAVYERFKGRTIPAVLGLKNLLGNEYHIVNDRITPALRVLIESAEQAGFFETGGRTKLIIPIASSTSDESQDEANNQTSEVETEQQPSPITKTSWGGGDEPPTGIHTAIIGLLRELPKAGTPWESSKKERFMQAFKSTIDFIYPEEQE